MGGAKLSKSGPGAGNGDNTENPNGSSPPAKKEEGKESKQSDGDKGDNHEGGANPTPRIDLAEASSGGEKPKSSSTNKRKRQKSPKPAPTSGGSRVVGIEEDKDNNNTQAMANSVGEPMPGTLAGTVAQMPPTLFQRPASSATSSMKRSARAESPEPTPEDLARMSRSERKRHREKKRRSDVNKGFDDLMALLVQIDPSMKAEAEDRARKSQVKAGADVDSSNLINRVELISRAATVLERVHRENEERKILIKELTSRLGGGAGTGANVSGTGEQVMMMVPTLTPIDSIMQAAATRDGLGMTPQYNFLPSSLAQVRMAQQAAAIPSGQFMGFGSHGFMQSFPSRTQPGLPPSGRSSTSAMIRNEQMDRSSDESPTTKRQREFRERRW